MEKLLKTEEGPSQYEQEGVAEDQWLSQCRNPGWAQAQEESIQNQNSSGIENDRRCEGEQEAILQVSREIKGR